ncbi:pitrilysin family protein [Ideonella sp. DXS29W]|uniref:Pitrilysin family protein n=1 Tax=Ideonella lacteola TaxID=2984193 RepID=A0ABU9BU99_9BURK
MSTTFTPDPDTRVHTLPNGVRVLTLQLPRIDSVCVSIFVRTGSRHESPRLNGISHMAEHMAFKGTRHRSCQQINLDAERLGAEVNAHTDKDHTAYHMQGLAEHAPLFVRMLGEIVRDSSFPADELERERQVILQEFAETEDDAFDTAFRLFDEACYGAHPQAQPVIGRRRNIERFTREQLQDYVSRQYTGSNIVVAVAGKVDVRTIVREARQALGGLPTGQPNESVPPEFQGGIGLRRLAGHSQAHVVLGFPAPPVTAPRHAAHQMAAALLGEGMSSPLMDSLRERLGLVYYAACSADLGDLAGQFVIEASMSPDNIQAFTDEVVRLMQAQTERIDPLQMERARNQVAVRRLQTWERPARRLEEAVLDLYTFGRVRSREERRQALARVTPRQLRAVFAQMLAGPVAVAAAGRLGRAGVERLKAVAAVRA